MPGIPDKGKRVPRIFARNFPTVHQWIMAWPAHPKGENRDWLYPFRSPISLWGPIAQNRSHANQGPVGVASGTAFLGIKLEPGN